MLKSKKKLGADLNLLTITTNFLAVFSFVLNFFTGSGSRKENEYGSMRIRIAQPLALIAQFTSHNHAHTKVEDKDRMIF